MAEAKIVFRRNTGNKKKDEKILEVDEDKISLQNKQENALIISFKASEDEISNINKYFEDFNELEPVYLEIANAGEVEHYFRGISPINDVEENQQQFSVTLQLKREFV